MDSYMTCGVVCVRHSEPFLVVPAEPTPNEIKQLSDIDDQEWLRAHHSLIMFYKSSPCMTMREEADPAKVIVRGISRALVHYYPLAGRLIQGTNRKLFVDCTGEGVLFTEAEADIALDQLGDSIGPPCPHMKQFLHEVMPGSDGILGCPLLLFQVTRFSCGGFALAVRMNHVVCDTPGLVQFLNTVATFAKDPHATVLQLPPVWQREQIFSARDPPRVTRIHHEYDDDNNNINNNNDMAHDSFFFGPKEILTLRSRLPIKLRKKWSTFELLSACLWKCRTIALDMNPNDVVAFSAFISARGKLRVPDGYYGNAFGFPAAVSEAGSLCRNTLEYALELIREAKGRMDEEYMRSLASLVALKGRPMYRTAGHFLVGDTTRVGFERLDFGWGRPVYGGPAGAFDPLISFFARFRNSRGQDGIMVPIMLPRAVMKRFLMEVVKMTSDDGENVSYHHHHHHHRANDQMETKARSML